MLQSGHAYIKQNFGCDLAATIGCVARRVSELGLVVAELDEFRDQPVPLCSRSLLRG